MPHHDDCFRSARLIASSMRLFRVRTLLPVFAAAVLLLGGPQARAGDREQPIKIYVDSILATYSPQIRNTAGVPSIKMDARLSVRGIADRLRMMFAYNDYQLKQSQEAQSRCGSAVAFNLPGGRIIHVAPIGYVGSELALGLTVFEGRRVVMDMPIKLIGGGMLMLIDEREPGQFYITAISADSPVLAHVQLSPGLLPEVEAPVKISPALIPAQ